MAKLSQTRPFLKIDQAADYLRVPTGTVRAMIEANRLKAQTFFSEPFLLRNSVEEQLLRQPFVEKDSIDLAKREVCEEGPNVLT